MTGPGEETGEPRDGGQRGKRGLCATWCRWSGTGFLLYGRRKETIMSDMRIKPVFAWYQGSESPVFERLKSRQVNPLFLGWTKMLPEGTTAKEMWAACPEGSWLLEYARECGYHHDEHGRAKLVEAACACSKLAVRHVFKDDLAAHKMIDSLDRCVSISRTTIGSRGRKKKLRKSKRLSNNRWMLCENS